LALKLAKTPPVAIVNQEFARRLFDTDDAVGRYFKNHGGVSIQIVGIVADGKYFDLSEDQEAAAFFPISQKANTSTALVVRTRRDTADMVAAIRGVVLDLDRAIPIRELGPWNTQLGLSFFPVQVATVALGIFGAFGLLLSNRRHLRPRLLYSQQAAARAEYSCRTRCAGEADSLCRARPHASPAC
jgi:hypothetical protein